MGQTLVQAQGITCLSGEFCGLLRLADTRQAHGTGDPLLPYAAAGWLQALLAQGGLDVQFESHNGGHDLGPPDMLNKLGKFLAEL